MANIAALGNLAPVEQLDLDNYAENKPLPPFRLPARGVYTLRAPERFPDEAFGASKAGALTVQIDPTIVGPDSEGFQVRYVRVSAKTFQRDGKTVSQLGDYLKACGITGAFKSPQELADAAEQTAGLTYQAELDWRVYNGKTGFKVEGMVNFPKQEDGSYQSWVIDPNDTDDAGEPKRLRANLYIRNFIAA